MAHYKYYITCIFYRYCCIVLAGCMYSFRLAGGFSFSSQPAQTNDNGRPSEKDSYHDRYDCMILPHMIHSFMRHPWIGTLSTS